MCIAALQVSRGRARARALRQRLPYLRDSISPLKTCRTFFRPLSALGEGGTRQEDENTDERGRRLCKKVGSVEPTLSRSLPSHTTVPLLHSHTHSLSFSLRRSPHSVRRPRCSGGGGRYDCFLIVSGDKRERGRAGESDLPLPQSYVLTRLKTT